MNRHERLFLHIVEGDLTSHAQIRERFWEWLKRDEDERLKKNSGSAATLDEALDQWGAATNLELDAVDAHNLITQNDHAGDVQFALMICQPPASCVVGSLMTEGNRQTLTALGGLGDLELPLTDEPRAQSPMDAQPSDATLVGAQPTNADVDMTEMTTTHVEADQAPSEEMEVTSESVVSAQVQVPQPLL